MVKELIIPDSGDGNSAAASAQAQASVKELIIPDSGDGNKSHRTSQLIRRFEGIDNPRLRGRKPSFSILIVFSPMKDLIIPDSGDGNFFFLFLVN